jgi:alpha-galactosidase
MYILESSYLQFVLKPDTSSWSLHGVRIDSPSLEDVWMRASYRMGPSSLLRTRRMKFQFMERWFRPRISKVQEVPSAHGPLNQLVLEMGPDVNGICYRLEFALSVQHPLFLWRLTLENNGRRSIDVDKLEMLRAGFFPVWKILPNPGPLSGFYQTKPIGYGAVRPNPNPGDLGFFSNGWQSWSYTGVYGAEDVYRATQLGLFAAPVWYAQGKTPRRKPGFFTSDMFGIIGDRTHRTGILAGFLSQIQHFGSLEAHIADPLYPALNLWADGDRTRLQPGATMSTDWAVIQFVDLDSLDPLAPYIEAVAREHHLPSASLPPTPITGWCSWYQFFEDIDADKLRTNLQSAAEARPSIPLELFQIDAGFESQIGDWFSFSPGFPEGVASLARDIQNSGFKPGLWLAPFIVHSRSKLAGSHRGWLLRNRAGLPASAGFLWNNFSKALDLTQPEALAYACEVVRTAAQTWGYPYLKLDFLYAAAIKGLYRDRTKTRAQVIRMGLEAIREAVGPEVTLLGCGVPLGSAVGVFDAVRIGADVDPCWEPHFIPPQVMFRSEPNMPSTRNALQNTLTRTFFHNHWWINDPDCLMIRPESNLTLAEVQSLATAIAITGGSMLLSDNLPQLPAERWQIAGQMIPLIGKQPWVLDWFDAPTPRLLRLDLENTIGQWNLLAVFNWTNTSQDITLPLTRFNLPPGKYFAREFWSGALSQVYDGMLILNGIPSHGVKLLSLRLSKSNCPRYLGSNLHISQGLEVTEWSVSASNEVRFQLKRPGRTRGVIDLYLPHTPGKVVISQGKIDWHLLGDGYYQLQAEFEQEAVVEIT